MVQCSTLDTCILSNYFWIHVNYPCCDVYFSSNKMEQLVSRLSQSDLCCFCDWPNKFVPRIAAGVYAIYDRRGRFLYVGMAGAGLSKNKVKQLKEIKGRKSGLFDRLGSHATGYRSGDRFNIYLRSICLKGSVKESNK